VPTRWASLPGRARRVPRTPGRNCGGTASTPGRYLPSRPAARAARWARVPSHEGDCCWVSAPAGSLPWGP